MNPSFSKNHLRLNWMDRTWDIVRGLDLRSDIGLGAIRFARDFEIRDDTLKIPTGQKVHFTGTFFVMESKVREHNPTDEVISPNREPEVLELSFWNGRFMGMRHEEICDDAPWSKAREVVNLPRIHSHTPPVRVYTEQT